MAVVQISRIQVRRGQKNQGSGIPQLAGGEFGWAVDTRELYIGNGSVAEGAPAVGNSKIITEHDNLFTLADSYTYLNGVTVQTGASATSPIKRTLQSRLDEIVSIKSFGGTGDGTDQTLAVQRAIDQLFINPATKGTEVSRVKLHFPAGIYKISSSIHIPPYASIIGDGIDKTKFRMTANTPAFKTVNGSSEPGAYADGSSNTSDNQATNIHMEGFTIDYQNTDGVVVDLDSCKSSVFKEIKITGEWTTGDAIDSTNIGVRLKSLSSLVGSQKNKFEHVMFNGLSVGVASDDDIYNNHWQSCYFDNLGQGIVFGENTVIDSPGQSTGPSKNKIYNSSFSNIDREGIVISIGSNNLSTGNNFEGVGNLGGNEGNATTSVIDFSAAGNDSSDDFFARTAALSYNQSFITNNKYVSEIKGKVIADIGSWHQLEIQEASSYQYFFRLPGDYTRTYQVQYSYSSDIVNAQRTGVMTFQLDKNNSNAINFVDDHNYQGDSAYESNLQFQATMVDTDGTSGVDTLIVSMLNSTTNDQGQFNFKIKVLS